MRLRYIESRLAAIAAVALLAAPLAAQPHSALAPQTGSTITNLNGLTDRTVISSQFSGVTVSGGLCAADGYAAYFGGDPIQASNFDLHNRGANAYACNGSFGQAFTFTFSQAINSFGFMAITDGGNITFTTGNGSVTESSPYRHEAYYGLTDATPFTWVNVSVSGDGLIVLDDVSTTAPPVTVNPEPASLALMATGLVGVIGVARRRRKA